MTGGASGIGRALCEQLVQRGATVVVADINNEGAEQVASAIASGDSRAHAAYVDVSQAEDVERLVGETVAEHGRLDFMFNNAGIIICGKVCNMDLEHWQHIIDVNLWGVIHGTMAAYQVMIRQGFGHIVNTASMHGLIPMPSTPYTAAKHAVVGLSTMLRLEAAELGVRVSVTCPGTVRTGVFDTAMYVGTKRETVEELSSSLKMMDAADCARAILRGVQRNQGIILDGAARNRLSWWLYRLSPELYCTLHEIRKRVRS